MQFPPASTGRCCCCFLETQILQPCWKRAGDICTFQRLKRSEEAKCSSLFFFFIFAGCCWLAFPTKTSAPCGFSEYDSKHLFAPTSASSWAVPPIVLQSCSLLFSVYLLTLDFFLKSGFVATSKGKNVAGKKWMGNLKDSNWFLALILLNGLIVSRRFREYRLMRLVCCR